MSVSPPLEIEADKVALDCAATALAPAADEKDAAELLEVAAAVARSPASPACVVAVFAAVLAEAALVPAAL